LDPRALQFRISSQSSEVRALGITEGQSIVPLEEIRPQLHRIRIPVRQFEQRLRSLRTEVINQPGSVWIVREVPE
jgi:hypothetical protein